MSRMMLKAVTDLPQPWIESVANGIAEQVGGKDREEDRHSRPDHEPARVEEEGLGVGKHVAPARSRRSDAEAQEVKRRLDEDDRTQVQAREDDQSEGDGVRLE